MDFLVALARINRALSCKSTKDKENANPWDFLEHGILEFGDGRHGYRDPDIMSKVKDLISMHSSLGDVEIRSKEVNHERIEEPVYEFGKDFRSFL